MAEGIAHTLQRDHAQTVGIRERQLDSVFFREADHDGNGSFDDLGESDKGAVKKKDKTGEGGRDENEKKCERDPFLAEEGESR